MAAPELRLRATCPGLLVLPWDRPLRDWAAPQVALREMAVGPSRHLVRLVEADGQLWALKELPPRIAAREYGVRGRLEEMGLNAVRPAGVVIQPDLDTAILVTRYLVGSWQYRRMFMRLPPDAPKHRTRLFDAMATLPFTRGNDVRLLVDGEATFEALFEALEVGRRLVSRHDHLAAVLDQRVEGVKELLLRRILAADELNVVDHQHVDGPELLLE